MVYPRESGLRTLSKFIAVCALASSLRSPAAESVTVTTTASAVCTAADGDIAGGVQAIPDASCVTGGLGCYSDHCRYCKYSETSKSAHLPDCSGFGYNFPTLTPEPATGECDISDGDKAVGIRAISDASCVIGGLGCFNRRCRFCKEVETSKSAHLAACSTFGASTTTPAAQTGAPASATPTPVATSTSAPVVTATPVPVTTGTSAPVVTNTVAPVVTNTAAPVAGTSVPTTSAPSTETPATTDAAIMQDPFGTADTGSTECTIDDMFKSMGLDVVADPDVVSGMDDYYSNGCRFCKTEDLTELATFTYCALFPAYYSAETSAPETPEPAANTSAPVITSETTAPTILVVDTVTPTPIVDTVAPAVNTTDTNATTVDTITFAPVVDTDAPAENTTVTDAPVVVAPVCTTPVSEGDAAAGIEIITDATCASGGLGCIDTICRFCKVAETTLSAHLDSCSDLLGQSAASSSLDATCDMVVNPGDSAVGLTIVEDASCLEVGGLGCIDDTACKFCKMVETPQSAVYPYCDGFPVTPVPSDSSAGSAAVVVTETPSVPAVDVAVACAGNELSTGDANGGVAYTYDPVHCPAGTAAGCLGEAGCKLCKHTNTSVSSHLDFCPGYPVESAEAQLPDLSVQSTAAAAKSTFGQFFDHNRFLVYPTVAAACVGAIAVLVAAVVGTRRVVRRFRRRRHEHEDEEIEESASVLVDGAVVRAEEAAESVA